MPENMQFQLAVISELSFSSLPPSAIKPPKQQQWKTSKTTTTTPVPIGFDLVCCDHKWKPQSMIHWYCHKWSGCYINYNYQILLSIGVAWSLNFSLEF